MLLGRDDIVEDEDWDEVSVIVGANGSVVIDDVSVVLDNEVLSVDNGNDVTTGEENGVIIGISFGVDKEADGPIGEDACKNAGFFVCSDDVINVVLVGKDDIGDDVDWAVIGCKP